MTADVLPPRFANLDEFSDWIIPTERARVLHRNARTMDELQHFYDVMLPFIPDMVAYLDQYPVGHIPSGPDENLYRLLLACIEVSHPIELEWKSARNPIAFPVERLIFRDGDL